MPSRQYFALRAKGCNHFVAKAASERRSPGAQAATSIVGTAIFVKRDLISVRSMFSSCFGSEEQ